MNRGYIIIFNAVLFVAILVVILVGVVNPIISNYSGAEAAVSSKKAFLLVDSATEEAIYRLKNSKNIAPSQTLNLSQGVASIGVTNTPSGKKLEVSSAVGVYQKNTVVNVSLGTGISFHYGIQSGNGGFEMQNSSTVTGNVFSTGSVTGSGNMIYGDVISAGPLGLMSGIHATGTVYAHNLQNSTIDKDAHYVTIDSFTNSHVSGTKYPNSPDQDPVDLPISDEQIEAWEQIALLGGTATCSGGTYTISSGSVSLGPIKIPCDLVISNSAIVTIEDHIWVTGNIIIKNSALIKMASSLGSQNVAIIADNPSDRISSSKISVLNTATFQNSGTAGSFVFLISQNNSAELGGSEEAFTLSNSASALVAYAAHGLIPLANSVSLKEVTAYKITLKNSANVTYDTGLPNTLFEAGPGGGYNLVDWAEI